MITAAAKVRERIRRPDFGHLEVEVTVDGPKASPGAPGPVPVVAGGLLFVNSGYGGLLGIPGNVLLVFGVA